MSKPPEQPPPGPAQQNRGGSYNGGLAAFLIIIAVVIIGANHLSSKGDKRSPDVAYYKFDAVVTVTTDFYACDQLDDLNKIKSFFVAKDNVAAARYAVQASCDPFRAGLRAVVEDNSVWHASVCLRPQGETACRWFPALLVNGPSDQKIGG